MFFEGLGKSSDELFSNVGFEAGDSGVVSSVRCRVQGSNRDLARRPVGSRNLIALFLKANDFFLSSGVSDLRRFRVRLQI